MTVKTAAPLTDAQIALVATHADLLEQISRPDDHPDYAEMSTGQRGAARAQIVRRLNIAELDMCLSDVPDSAYSPYVPAPKTARGPVVPVADLAAQVTALDALIADKKMRASVRASADKRKTEIVKTLSRHGFAPDGSPKVAVKS
jgi:hypothetical protein